MFLSTFSPFKTLFDNFFPTSYLLAISPSEWSWREVFYATLGCGLSFLIVTFIRNEIRLRQRRHARIERQSKLHKSVNSNIVFEDIEEEEAADDDDVDDDEEEELGEEPDDDTLPHLYQQQQTSSSPTTKHRKLSRKASFSSSKSNKDLSSLAAATAADEKEDEISYRVRTIKMFRYVDESLARSFCQYFEEVNFQHGDVLFRKGDLNPDLWIVMSGTVQLFQDENDPSTHLCDVTHGESVMSLISYIDVMADEESLPCQVSARVLDQAKLLRVSSQTFRTLANAAPQAVAQIVQMIMFRLQRVTFLTLYHYLGLTEELMTSTDDYIDTSKATASPAGDTAKNLPWSERAVQLILSRLGEIQPEDVELLRSTIKRIELKPGQFLHEAPILSPPDAEKSTKDDVSLQKKPAIHFCVSGSMTLYMNQRSGTPHPLYEVGIGGIIGHMSALTGDQSDILAKATKPTQLVSISREVFNYIAARNPRVVLKIALSLVRRLTPFVRQFDFALDWRYRKAGKVLFEEGDSCLGLYIVLHGRLRSFHRNSSSSYSTASDMNVNSLSWSIGAGGAGFVEEFARGDSVGEIDLLTESNHSSTVIAIRDTEVCQIPRSLFNMIVKRYPFVMAHFARAMYKRIGGSLKRLNTSSAPSIHEKFSFSALAPVKKRPAGDGSNDGTAAAPTPGTSTPTSTPTSTTSTSVFSSTSAASSATTTATATATATAAGVGSSASAVLEATKASSTPTTTTTSSATTTTATATATTNIPPALAPFVSTTSGAHGLATIAVIGASENVPLHAFTARLVACLSKLGQTLHLNNQIVVSHFATNSVTRLDKIRLTSWLGRLEEENDVVVYEAENSASSWTKRCIRQADLILLVTNGRDGPRIGEVEREIEEFLLHSNARKELVILHDEDEKESQQLLQRSKLETSSPPSSSDTDTEITKTMKVILPNGTRFWASARAWTNAHHHVCLHRHLLLDTEHYKSDFARLARRIRGQSIGLVLGGGGAKGLSHVGILKQLEEHEIPIDMIGGTSIGAFVGGLYAKYRDAGKVEEKTIQYCKMFSNRRRLLPDITLPLTSFLAGDRYNRILRTIFTDTQIEDFWLPYFCTTTNITTNSLNIHQEGRAWRFIRASMSLASFLPPLCEGNNLLLDGGYCNNLPADIMQSLGANTIIAIHVGTEDNTNYYNYGDSLSGWWLLWKKINPFASPVHIPSMSDISQRICYIRSDINLEMVKNAYCSLYLRPPVNHYPLLAFNKYNEISNVGYEFAKQRIAEWISSGYLDTLHIPCKESVQAAKEQQARESAPFLRRNSSFIFA